jgi:pilus assembly protein CpaF
MTLRERLAQPSLSTPAGDRSVRPGTDDGDAAELAYRRMRSDLHRQLLDRVDLGSLSVLPTAQLADELRELTERLISESGLVLNAADRRRLLVDIRNEVMGLGPLEPLLADPGISDILVNTHRQIFVERSGRLEHTSIRFDSEQHLLKIIDKIVSRVGRRVDESSPMVDARLADGSRVNAIIPPLAIDGALLSIRRFSAIPLTMSDLVSRGSVAQPVANLLAAMVRGRLNILVSGGTGAGKTTLLNVLSAAIPEHERIVTIEDAAELQLQQPHVVRLETRPPNIEGRGEVTQRALVRNSLRMRPDRIILGEVRGAEAFDMLQAMNTGHEGSLATIHANTPRDALSRLENMLGMAGMSLSPRAMRQQVASAIQAVIQVSRFADGSRRLVSLSEVSGMEGEVITMQEIFGFRQTGVDPGGRVQGSFHANGVRPRFMDRLRERGLVMDDAAFAPGPLSADQHRGKA